MKVWRPVMGAILGGTSVLIPTIVIHSLAAGLLSSAFTLTAWGVASFIRDDG